MSRSGIVFFGVYVFQSGGKKTIFSRRIDVILLKEVQAKCPHESDDPDSEWKKILDVLKKACKHQKILFHPTLRAIKDRYTTLVKNFRSKN